MELSEKQIDLVIYLLENYTFDAIRKTYPNPNGDHRYFCGECFCASDTAETLEHSEACDTPAAIEFLALLTADESEAGL